MISKITSPSSFSTLFSPFYHHSRLSLFSSLLFDFKKEFSSDWMKKKLEARRDVMQKIVKHYFGDYLVTGMQDVHLSAGPAYAPPASPAYAPASSPAYTPVTSPAHTPVASPRAHAATSSPYTSPYVPPMQSTSSTIKPVAAAAAAASEGAHRGHYVYSSDDTESRVYEYLTRWQMKHLSRILFYILYLFYVVLFIILVLNSLMFCDPVKK